MKPLDSSDGSVGSASIEPDGSLVPRIAPSAPILAEPDASEGDTPDRDPADQYTPDASAEAAREPPVVIPSRISQIVPVGTSDEERGRIGAAPDEAAPDEAAPPARASEIAPVDPAVREARAAFRQSEFGETLHGTGFGSEEDEEATTVDAGAALNEEEQLALMRRIRSAMGPSAMGHSAMEETAPYGTPAPEPVQPMSATPGLEYDARSPFKHTMLLGLPQLRPQPPSEAPAAGSPEPDAGAEGVSADPPAPPASAEPALMASLVRVVGPPTQPPPRRVRRPGSTSPDGVNEPDHEAFVLTHPIAPPDARRSSVPGVPGAPGALAASVLVTASGAPISLSSANGVSGLGSGLGNGSAGPSSVAAAYHDAAHGNGAAASAGYSTYGSNSGVSRGSIPPQLMLPPPPRPQDYEPASSNASSPVASRSPSYTAPPPSRTRIESPAALLRTRPPASRPSTAPPPALHDLPTSDPFAGFVAPPPSIAQRGLVVIVVALAVVGVCALVAIAFGLLGKTGW